MATNAVISQEGSNPDATEDNLSKATLRTISPSLPSLHSESSTSSQVSVYNFRKILRWLDFVDGNLDKDSCRYLLYLGAYPEVKGKDYETIVIASNFYRVLQEKSPNDTQTLARFMYALHKLGRKKRGIYCNNQFKKTLRIDPPPYLEIYEEKAAKDKEFGFYQCLVDICVTLEEDGNEMSTRVRKFACNHVLGILPQNERTVSKVFIKMLKKPEILSVENHEQLALILGQVGAKSSLFILQHFRSQFKLDEIEWEKVQPYLRYMNISPAGSMDVMSLTSGGSAGSGTGSRNRSPFPSSPSSLVNDSRANSPRTQATIIEDLELATHGAIYNTDETTPLLVQRQPPANHPPHEPEIQQAHVVGPPPGNLPDPVVDINPVKKYRWKRILFMFLCVGLPLLIAAGAGTSMIVLASIESSDLDASTTVYTNTTVALGHVQKFNTKHVSLYQDPENGEVFIPMQFYRSNKYCNSLYSTDKIDIEKNKSLVLKQQIPLFRGYLVHGSHFSYSICVVTNQRNGTNYHVDFYIADGLDEDLPFDADKSHFVLHQDIDILYNPYLNQPVKNCFIPIEHTLKETGSYSVIILLPPSTEVPFSNISVWYNREDRFKVIDTSHLTPVCADNSNNHSDPCVISIGSREHFISVFCIVVKVEHSDYDSFTHIHAILTDTDIEQIWFYVLGGFVFIVIFSICILIFILAYFCKNHCIHANNTD